MAIDEVKIVDLGNRVPAWSTEETLDEVKDLLRVGVQWQKKDEKYKTRAEKKAEARAKKNNKSREDASKNQASILRKVFTGSLTKLVKGTIVGGASIETVFKRMAQTGVEMVSDIIIVGPALLGLVGTIISLTNVVREAVNQYLQLYDTGVILNGRFLDLMHISAQAGISLIDMTEALKGHSETIVRLSTENNKGAFAFAELSASVRDSFFKINMLGLSLSEVNEYFLDYLDIQRIAGSVQQLNTQRTTEHFTEYMRQLSKLSVVTGIQRKQLQEQVNETLRDDSFNAKLAGLGEEARAQIIKNLAAVTPLGPAMVSAFKDQFVFGAIGISESARGIAQFMPEAAEELKKFVESARRGEKTDAFAFLAKFQQDSERFIETYGDTASLLGRLGNSVLEGVTTSAHIGRQMDLDRGKLNTRLNASIESFMLKWDPLKSQILSQFLETAASILEGFEDSGVFDTFFDIVLELSNSLLSFLREDWNPFIRDTLKPGLEDLGVFLNDLIVDLNAWLAAFNKKAGSPGEKIAIMFDNLVNHILISFEWLIDRLVDKLTLGLSGTEDDLSTYRRNYDAQQEQDDLNKNQQSKIKREYEDWRKNRGFVNGGIARVPSIFGEGGPEVAIPLASGDKIPVAEVRRSAAEIENDRDIIKLLKDIKDRLEFQSGAVVTTNNTLKSIDRKAGKDNTRVW